MKKVRLGIVGLGARGRHMGLLYHNRIKDCQVVAICDHLNPVLERVAAEIGNPDIKTFTDYGQMLREADIDAVGVFIEPDRQADLICEALYAGKHVTCDVPLAFTFEGCWKVLIAVEKTGMKFLLSEQTRYWPFIQAWREMAARGELGKIFFMEGQYFHELRTGKYFWVDAVTGKWLRDDEIAGNPNARKTWRNGMHPIVYMPHELSPLLSIIDDRVVKTTCFATRPSSYVIPGVEMPDIEVALMHTEKDTILRLACSFTVSRPLPNHWYHVWGTKGEVETKRDEAAKHKMWLAEEMLRSDSPKDMDWSYDPKTLPQEAVGSGHDGADYFPAAAFVKCIIEDTAPPLDVYRAVDITAPAVAASISAAQGGSCIYVPDFRPSVNRALGQMPKGVKAQDY